MKNIHENETKAMRKKLFVSYIFYIGWAPTNPLIA